MNLFCRSSAFISIAVSICIPSFGQLRNVEQITAIVEARIEIGDGRSLEKATVILKNGLISDVGVGISVPSDANVIDGKGLIVYPGFIDCGFSKGVKYPEFNPNPDDPKDTKVELQTEMREANRKGIRPEFRAVTNLDFTNSLAEPIRKLGFTTCVVVPSGGYMSGQAAVVNLSGRARREIVLKADIWQCFALQSNASGNPYPGTVMGAIALLKQTLLDNDHLRRKTLQFNRSGGPRPAFDESISSLTPVLDGKQAAVFEANESNRIVQGLHLFQEFRVAPILFGGIESFRLVDQIKQWNLPVLLGLNWGEEPKTEDSKVDKKPANDAKPGTEKVTDKDPEEMPKPEDEKYLVDEIIKERRRIWEQKVGTAGLFSKRGIAIGFISKGLKSQDDFLPAVRNAVKLGLSKADALKALTSGAAAILGLDKQIGKIQVGLAANLAVFTGDFTEEKSKVKYVFIDGRKFEPEAPKEGLPMPLPSTVGGAN